jgi:hypothetical protein
METTNVTMKNLIALLISGALVVSGYSQTRNVLVGTNNAVVQPTNFWSGDASNARSGLGLGLPALTNTNVTNFRTAIGLGATNDVTVNSLTIAEGTNTYIALFDDGGEFSTGITMSGNFGISFSSNAAGITRTNLGLGWSALTNSNAGTSLVSVSTNGEVVSPTNFWQVAPITTTFIDSQPTTNQTTNIAAGRNLHIHSIAFSTVGITNTIALPTTNSFNGDVALVVHQGPTSSVTAVRTAGASTNLITLNQFEEAVEFVYYNSVWQFNHNRSFIEPIFFSGTNAAANRAASVTNLFTPNTPLVFNTNGQVVANTGTNALSFTNGAIISTVSESIRVTINSSAFSVFSDAQGVNVLHIPSDDTVQLNGGYWNDPSVRASLGFSTNLNTVWTATNVTNFRSAIGLGTANDVQFGRLFFSNEWHFVSSPDGGGVEFRWPSVGGVTFISMGGNAVGYGIRIGSLGGSGENDASYGFTTNNASGAAKSRTNFGLGLPALTNTNVTNFRTAIGLGPTNTPIFNGVNIGNWLISTNASGHIEYNKIGLGGSALTLRLDTLELGNSLAGDVALAFNSNNATGAAISRTNLGLGGTDTPNFAGITFLTNGAGVRATGSDGILRFDAGGEERMRLTAGYRLELQGTNGHLGFATNNTNGAATTRTNLGIGGGITTNLILKNSANQDTYMNFSNGILKYGSTTPP